MMEQLFSCIRIHDQQYSTYSKIILLSSQDIPLDISVIINPFVSSVSFNMTVPEDHAITVSLYDTYGRLITRETQTAGKGLNHYDLGGLGNLQSGMYVLQVLYKDRMLTKQLIKKVE